MYRFMFSSSGPSSPEEVTSTHTTTVQVVENLIQQNPVVVFGISSCCMCLVVKELFSSIGVHPLLLDIDRDFDDGVEIERNLARLAGSKQPIPLIFIGGKLVGGLDSLMASHITGKLIDQLKEANVKFY